MTTKFFLAAILSAVCWSSLHVRASLITAEFSGTFDDVVNFPTPDFPGFAVGDNFHVTLNFDSEAILIQTVERSPGSRYQYDPSSLYFDVTIGGNTITYGKESNVAPFPGFDDLIFFRDNTGDVSVPGEAGPVDGYSFRKGAVFEDGSAYLINMVFRTTDTTAYSGPGIPTDLFAAEFGLFSIQRGATTDINALDEGFEGAEGQAALKVPLPGTVALLGIGLAGLGWKRRKSA